HFAGVRREGGREVVIMDLQAGEHRAFGAPEPQYAVGCRIGGEIAVGPFGEQFHVRPAHQPGARAGPDPDGAACAGHAIEENGRSGGRHGDGDFRVHQMPPAPSASARPSPTAELGRLASARTYSIASKPASEIESTANRQIRSLMVI